MFHLWQRLSIALLAFEPPLALPWRCQRMVLMVFHGLFNHASGAVIHWPGVWVRFFKMWKRSHGKISLMKLYRNDWRHLLSKQFFVSLYKFKAFHFQIRSSTPNRNFKLRHHLQLDVMELLRTLCGLCFSLLRMYSIYYFVISHQVALTDIYYIIKVFLMSSESLGIRPSCKSPRQFMHEACTAGPARWSPTWRKAFYDTSPLTASLTVLVSEVYKYWSLKYLASEWTNFFVSTWQHIEFESNGASSCDNFGFLVDLRRNLMRWSKNIKRLKLPRLPVHCKHDVFWRCCSSKPLKICFHLLQTF